MTLISDEGVLAGLAAVPWADLTHAYGPAEDVPGLLRAAASGDPAAAGEAVYELFGTVWHQGTVYQATPYTVPFLARMAAAGAEAGQLAALLGCIAASTDDHTAGQARAAVAAQAPLLAPLLGHPDPGTRRAAAWALAMARAGTGAFDALRSRWAAEDDPVVRPALLKAMSVLDPARALPVAAGAVAGGASPGERLVAAGACLAAGRAWDEELRAAATAWLGEGLALDDDWWGDSTSGPFAALLRELAKAGAFPAAAGLAVASLELATAPGTLEQAVRGVDWFAGEYRVPAPELTAALQRVPAGTAAAKTVASLLGRLEPAGPGAVPAPAAGLGYPSAAQLRARAAAFPADGIREALRCGQGLARAAIAARGLDGPPPWLVPALRSALRGHGGDGPGDLAGRVQVARTLWQLTGDAPAVIPALAGGLADVTSSGRPGTAARLAAELAGDLGPAAAPLSGGLIRLLADPATCPVAARALLAADPGLAGVPVTVLAGHLADAAGAEAGRGHLPALSLLRELSRRDPGAVAARVRAQLRDYAERPRRVIRHGVRDEVIRDDGALRAALRDLVLDLDGAGA